MTSIPGKTSHARQENRPGAIMLIQKRHSKKAVPQ